MAGLATPLLASLEATSTVTTAVGATESTTENAAVPPLPVVTRPWVGPTWTSGGSAGIYTNEATASFTGVCKPQLGVSRD